jgi:Cof subfamily protein (haloacid dehalogenase superfamily)
MKWNETMKNLSAPSLLHGRPIFCFDLDGTLLNDREGIHPADRRILEEESNSILFMPATGRTLESIRRTFHRNGLFTGGTIPFPLVLQNGSLLCRENEIFQSYHPFQPEVQEHLINAALKFKQVTFLFMDATGTYILSTSSTGQAAAERYEFTTHFFTDASRSLKFSKIMCIPEQPGDLAGFPELIESLPIERAYSTSTILELTPQGINKGVGVQRLIEAMHLSPQLIFAAGDAENDLPLAQIADHFFAPGNALEKVKANAIILEDIGRKGLLGSMMDHLP